MELADRARAWAADDVDAHDAAALLALLERAEDDGPGAAGAQAELADALDGDLEFGTAGLRGPLGPGSHRMNRAVVVRAAAGLAAHLHDAVPAGGGDDGGDDGAPVCVIGYDARHGSSRFAADTAAVMTAAGVRALLLPRALPTPVLAFAVRHLGADAGVMVTASHNPPQDNGYKVYLGGRASGDGASSGEGGSSGADVAGAQIVPPADARIAARIAAAPASRDVPRAQDGWEVLGEDLLEHYLAAVSALPGPAPADGRRGRLRVVLTPVHGVGGAVVVEALRRAGVTDVAVVPEQSEPDPAFPTTAFPNPEEPGVLDLALALARARGADLVIAVDPDADRCAVAVPDAAEDVAGAGGWRPLTGDELGSVLGEHVATGGLAAGTGPLPEGAVLACSLVSSQLLGRIAARHGLGHAETLTGFKWISRAPGAVFGYEEAIGYCVAPRLVRDKDGVSTAVVVAALAADLAASTGGPRGLLDVLDDLAVRHGVHATSQVSVRVQDLSLITAAMARLRAQPPARLGGLDVDGVDDLARGSVETTGVPPTDGLRWTLGGGGGGTGAGSARVVVRPSGTEPKLKCYLEVVVPVAGPDALTAARQRAAAALAALGDDVRGVLGL